MMWRNFEDEVVTRLEQIQAMLEIILRKETDMGADLTVLREKVTAMETVGDSLKELMLGLKAQLEAAATDPAAIQAIADEIGSKTDEWAVAVQANTQPSA